MLTCVLAATLPLLALGSALPSNLLVSRGALPAGSIRIHPDGDKSKCLELVGNKRSNNAPVAIANCDKSPGQDWLIPDKGKVGKIELFTSKLCLDAGDKPFMRNRPLKVYDCYTKPDGSPSVPQQTWVFTGDSKVALYDIAQPDSWCLTEPTGNKTVGSVQQIRTCGSDHQVWTTSTRE